MKYTRPENTEQLFDITDSLDDGSYILLAGGTDLLPRFEQGADLPGHLLDLKSIREFSGIAELDDGIEIGALTTIEEIKQSHVVNAKYPAIWQSTHDFAAVQIRNRATIGGNICNASPAADMLPPLYALGATVKLVSRNGERVLPIGEFITGPGRHELRTGEFICSIIVPEPAGISFFYKLGLRQAMAISVISFAFSGKVSKGGFSALKIAAGAVAPTVKYLEKYAHSLISNGASPAETIDLVDEEISPIDDIRASAGYRRRALKNTLAYELTDALKRAGGA